MRMSRYIGICIEEVLCHILWGPVLCHPRARMSPKRFYQGLVCGQGKQCRRRIFKAHAGGWEIAAASQIEHGLLGCSVDVAQAD